MPFCNQLKKAWKGHTANSGPSVFALETGCLWGNYQLSTERDMTRSGWRMEDEAQQRRSGVKAELLYLIPQRIIADVQEFGRLGPVIVRAFQRLFDDVFLQ